MNSPRRNANLIALFVEIMPDELSTPSPSALFPLELKCIIIFIGYFTRFVKRENIYVNMIPAEVHDNKLEKIFMLDKMALIT